MSMKIVLWESLSKSSQFRPLKMHPHISDNKNNAYDICITRVMTYILKYVLFLFIYFNHNLSDILSYY